MRASKWKWVGFLVLLHYIGLMAIVGEDWMTRASEVEAKSLAKELGPSAAERVTARGTAWYNTAFVDTGIVGASFNLFVAKPGDDPKGTEGFSQRVFPWAESRIRVFWTVLYQALVRAANVLEWVIPGLCLLVPAIMDGYARRRVKQTNFEYTSPDRFGWGVLMTQLTFFGYVVLLFAPFPLPTYVAPACYALTAFSAWLSLSNLNKRGV